MDEFYDEENLDFEEDEAIEAYCVSCRETIEIEDPTPVWTSKAQAATRGFCPTCGNNVFRMGRTYLHRDAKAPKPVQVVPGGSKGRTAKAAYIVSAVTDQDFAEKLGHELQQIGLNIWVDGGDSEDTTAWSGGVHPALDQCSHLVIVLSGFTEKTTSVQQAWEYFRRQRKPVIVVQVEDVDPPDDLRSRPRYNFTTDYKTAFRGLVEVLSR
jgi:hypothetical protein